MTVCPKCNGRGKTTEYDGLRKFWCDYKCEMCNGTGEVDMTNEEWLRSATTEQLAEWLSNTFDLCGAGCSKCFVKELCFNEHINKMPSDLIVEWLKQHHVEVPE